LALSVPPSRFTSRVGGGSAFYVRRLDIMTLIRSRERYKRLAKRAGIATGACLLVFIALFYSCVELASHKYPHSSEHPDFDWIAIICDLALLATVISIAVLLAAVILMCFAPKESPNKSPEPTGSGASV